MRANDAVFWGWPFQESAGEMPCPLHVYWLGIGSPGLKAELLIVKAMVPSFGDAVGAVLTVGEDDVDGVVMPPHATTMSARAMHMSTDPSRFTSISDPRLRLS
jgi:hypothetical protein